MPSQLNRDMHACRLVQRFAHTTLKLCARLRRSQKQSISHLHMLHACHSAIVCSPDVGLNEKLPHACIAAMPQCEPACIAGTLRRDPDAQVTSRVSQHHLTVAPLGIAKNKLLIKHINIASSIMRFRDKGT